ncbi:MAG: hypothetical protein IJ785_03650 [Bacteroidales bacterium]|nr:hypothetical protein [Bacteroidales bacterium]
MNRQHTLLTLGAAFVMLAFSSCQKDRMGSTFTATLERYADINTKTHLDGNRLKWDASDRIIVLNDNMNFGIYAATAGGAVTADFTYIDNASNTGWDLDVGNPEASCYGDGYPQANFFQAIYPAEIVDIQAGGVTLPATYSSPDGNLHGFPMYAYSTTNKLNFRNAFGLVKLTMYKANTTITSISVTADRPINGLFTIDNTTEWTLGQVAVPPLAYSSNGNNTTTLTLGTNGAGISIDDVNAKDFYICLPPGEYSSLTFTFTNSEGGYCTLSKNSPTTIARSQYTAFDLRDNDPTDELLVFRDISGLFSIGSNQYVKFSPGNLQYSPSTNVWRFAPTQLSYVGESQGDYFRGDVSSIEWIDLFGWGTGNNPTLCSTDDADYSTFNDWGNNTISNGGDYTWRTLTLDEWAYLAAGRPDAFQKVGGANVAGVNGFIFLPDVWHQPAGTTFVPGFGWNDFYSRNTYTAAQAQLMEAAGAIFLPAAGAMGTVTVSGTNVQWMYTHSAQWPQLGTRWEDAEGVLAPLVWLILQLEEKANFYWSATSSGDEYLSFENTNNTTGAYGGAFSQTGLYDDIFSHPDAEGVIQDGQDMGFYIADGLYAIMLPMAPQAKAAVRLVRDVVPGGSK